MPVMRRENGFEVTDHITVAVMGNGKLEEIVRRNEAVLRRVTLADQVSYEKIGGFEKEWDINGEKVCLSVK